MNKTESFIYDNLDRLKISSVNGGAAFSTNYFANGNIDNRNDTGTYSYHATKINAVSGTT